MVVEVGEKERRGRGGERWEGGEWLAWWRMNSASSFILDGWEEEGEKMREGFACKQKHGGREGEAAWGEAGGTGLWLGAGSGSGKQPRPVACESSAFFSTQATFSFEAGRRCLSGEGNFEFETRQGNEIFLALEEAIAAQKNASPPGPPTQPVPNPAALPRPESPYSRPHDSLPPLSPTTVRVPAPRLQRGPEGEYAVPFDAVVQNLRKSLRGILAVPPQAQADPLYESIEEHPPSRHDHIYDEPEGVAALSLYDSPQEIRGEAWRGQAAADRDPSGLQHVYPAGQDFAASGWPQGTEYDNVMVLKKGPK